MEDIIDLTKVFQNWIKFIYEKYLTVIFIMLFGTAIGFTVHAVSTPIFKSTITLAFPSQVPNNVIIELFKALQKSIESQEIINSSGIYEFPYIDDIKQFEPELLETNEAEKIYNVNIILKHEKFDLAPKIAQEIKNFILQNKIVTRYIDQNIEIIDAVTKRLETEIEYMSKLKGNSIEGNDNIPYFTDDYNVVDLESRRIGLKNKKQNMVIAEAVAINTTKKPINSLLKTLAIYISLTFFVLIVFFYILWYSKNIAKQDS